MAGTGCRVPGAVRRPELVLRYEDPVPGFLQFRYQVRCTVKRISLCVMSFCVFLLHTMSSVLRSTLTLTPTPYRGIMQVRGRNSHE